MELIDIYDENNNYLGYSAERDKVHENNLWHRHVSAWIMNNEGKILMQQRSFSKIKNPGKWAKTGGHVDSGESEDDAIKREVFEEIGLKGSCIFYMVLNVLNAAFTTTITISSILWAALYGLIYGVIAYIAAKFFLFLIRVLGTLGVVLVILISVLIILGLFGIVI